MLNSDRHRQPTMRRQSPPVGTNWYSFSYNKATKEADIYLYDEIGFWGKSAQDFVDELKELKNTEKINLHINSPGGQIFDGLAIYNSLKQHNATVTSFVDGLAASAASFIALAGDQVVMARNAEMMIHDGLAICIGNEADMLETADILNRFSNNIADIYFQKGGLSIEHWRAMMRAETWYSSFEARDAGLVDTVLDADDEEAEEATNKWDLTLFNHAGRDEAPSPVLISERVKVSNRAEEASMAKGAGPKAEADETTGTEPAATPSEDTSNEPVTPAEGDEAAGSEGTGEEAAAETNTAPAAVAAPTNQAGAASLMVNGVATSDTRAVQAHIDSLESFRDDTVTQSRTDFVARLASDNKIFATQIDPLTAHALGLNDEQFAAWSASYEDVPAQSLLAGHGQTPGDQGAPRSNEEARKDRIAILEQTVAQHRRAGKSEDQIKNTDSYKELQLLRDSQEG